MTAALLAQAGLRVVVLEKNPRVSGILASIEREGFKLDRGSHLVARGARGPLGQVLRQLGLDRPRFLTHPVPVRSRGIFEAIAPTHRGGLPATGLQVAHDLGLGPGDSLSAARLMPQIFTLTEPELRRWDHRTLHELLQGYAHDPRACYLLAFLASIFFVLPPWQVSAGESVRALRHLLWDYRLSHVEGGMDALPRALLGSVVGRGGEVLVSERVTAIESAGGSLRVHTAQGLELTAPVVACNLAPMDLLGLLDEEGLPPDWVARARAVQPSGAAHQLELMLARPLVDEGCFVGGVSTRGLGLDDLDLPLMQCAVDAIDAGRLADPLPLYATVPTNFDPLLAPPGRQIVLVSAYGPTTATPVDPPEAWKRAALDALEAILPGLQQELVACQLVPIPVIGAWMGKSSNAAICNGQPPTQVGRDRLPSQGPLPGLYLVGDGAGGRGIGTELAASSAMAAVHEILASAQRRAA